MNRPPCDPCAIAARFALPGRVLDAEPLGGGHIHDTFVATVSPVERFVLQRLNERVFPDLDGLMDNLGRVTRHLQAQGAPHALTLVPTADGDDWLRDGEGRAWRAFRLVPGAVSRNGVGTPPEACAVAAAFGDFQRRLADLPGPPLHEHLPGFHDGAARLRSLQDIAAADPCGRAASSRAELACALEHAHLAGLFADLGRLGAVPGIVHNDTKPDNLLRDAATGAPLCVIDLDTVMPGWRLADFGDLARAACCRAPEDERDLSRMQADADLFAGLARGFLHAAGPLCAPAERSALPDAAMAIVWEQGVRFLADWLAGDTYYAVHRPGHNLDRCRAQFALLRSLSRQADDLRARVARILDEQETA